MLRIQKDIFNEINIGEDVAHTYKCLLESNNLYVSDKANYVYRINETSMTQTFVKEMPSRILSLLTYVNEFYPKQKFNLDKQIKDYTSFLSFWVITNELKSSLTTKEVLIKLKEFLENKYVSNCFDSINLSFKQKFIISAIRKNRLAVFKLIRKLLRG